MCSGALSIISVKRELNRTSYEGRSYHWIPYHRGPDRLPGVGCTVRYVTREAVRWRGCIGDFCLRTGPFLPATSGRQCGPSSHSTANTVRPAYHRYVQCFLPRTPSTPRTPTPLGDSRAHTPAPTTRVLWYGMCVGILWCARPCIGVGPYTSHCREGQLHLRPFGGRSLMVGGVG